MIKSFSGQVVFWFASQEPDLLTLAKTEYPSILEAWHILSIYTNSEHLV